MHIASGQQPHKLQAHLKALFEEDSGIEWYCMYGAELDMNKHDHPGLKERIDSISVY